MICSNPGATAVRWQPQPSFLSLQVENVNKNLDGQTNHSSPVWRIGVLFVCFTILPLSQSWADVIQSLALVTENRKESTYGWTGKGVKMERIENGRHADSCLYKWVKCIIRVISPPCVSNYIQGQSKTNEYASNGVGVYSHSFIY